MLCQFLFFGGALIPRGEGVVGWGKKSNLGQAEIAYFSSRDFSRGNKLSMTHSDMLCRLDICSLDIGIYLLEPLFCYSFGDTR